MARLRAVPPLAWLAVGAVLVAGGALAAVLLTSSGKPVAESSSTPSPAPTALATASATASPSATPSASPSAVLARCPLNGMPIASLPPADAHALIVQIENHPLARPTRNLTNADIVIEAPVEGDVTRFSAIFYCQPTTGLTGPMRSARYYNIDLWQMIHGLTVHFGASNPALARFQAAGMPSINGLSGGWPFFKRYGTAPAPHNLYGDVEAVRAAIASDARATALAERAGKVRAPFRVDPAASVPGGSSVSKVTIKTNSYWTILWTWDASLGAWRRTDGGSADTDAATNKPVTATSVVVQRVTLTTVYNDPDPAGNPRRDVHLLGSGSGTLYVNGQAIPVKWSRAKAADLTTWTYVDGTPMVLPPGVIWWEMVPVTGSVTNS